jgi:hypothetical protein
MSLELLIYAAIGGVIPDALRVLKWARSPEKNRPRSPLTDPAIYVGLIIQVLLGVLAAYLLAVTTPFQAVAVGYAAPDLLTRLLGNIAGKQVSAVVSARPEDSSVVVRLLRWWQE